MSKNIITIKAIAEGYNKNISNVSETIKKNYPQYTKEAQQDLVNTEREKIRKEYKDKVNIWLSAVITDKNKIIGKIRACRYPLRASALDTLKSNGLKQKQNAILFLNGNYSENATLNEIKQAIELNEVDYASTLIEGARLKADLYTREELHELTQEQVNQNMDKVNRSNRYLQNPASFPFLYQLDKIEQENFSKMNEYKTELNEYKTEATILNDFQTQLEAGSDYLRSVDLFPYLTEAERLEAFNYPASSQIENISFRRGAAEILQREEGKSQ